MPPFLSQDEYESWAHDRAPLAAEEKLDAFFTEFVNQLENAKAPQAQTRSGLPLLPHQIYLKSAVLFENKADAQQAQTRSGLPLLPHQIYLKSAESDGKIEIERLSNEASDLRALLEQKDTEISQKDSAIDWYVDEIENLMRSAALKEARLEEIELELAESHASCARLSQELRSSKDAAVANQGRYLAEISSYKKVMKNYFQERLEEEKSARIEKYEFEKEAACLKEKLEYYEALEEEKERRMLQNL